MAGFFYKGILLQQRKEPALSRDLREFLNADTMGLQMGGTPAEEPDRLAYGEIIGLARTAHIIDERDGALLADKLLAARRANVRLLVVDAIDDEPYISSQLNPVLKNQRLAADGLNFCQKACGAQQAYFAVYKNLTDLEVRIPRRIGNYAVVRLHGRYPAEYQASLDYTEDDGALVVGSGAILHLARAILYHKPQTTTFITVAGDCIGNPTNLEVSLGMTVTQTLERCGLIDNPMRVVVGGSMTGIGLIDTDRTLVTPTTRAILAFRQDIKTLGLSCIGCARCSSVCPQGLNPYFLHRAIQEQRFDVFLGLDAQMCLGCGTCSYICPAKLDLSETIFQSMSKFSPALSSVHKTHIVIGENQDAQYARFLADFQLWKAIGTHKRDQRRLLRQYRSRCRQAEQSRAADDKETQRFLDEAHKSLEHSNHDADKTLAGALREMENAIASADKLVSDTEKARQAAWREADKALEEAYKAQIAMGDEADKMVLGVRKEQDRAVLDFTREGEKELARLEKAKDPPASPADLQKARTNFEEQRVQIAKRCDYECKRASINCEKMKEDARASYAQATVLCKRSKDNADASLVRAQEQADAMRSKAREAYALAEQQCARDKEQFVKIYQEAEAAAQTRRAAAGETLDASLAQIHAESLESQKALALALRQTRAFALAQAAKAAYAQAAVTGRPVRRRDLVPPPRLYECELELLSQKNFIPPLQGGTEPPSPPNKEEAAKNVMRLLAAWTGDLDRWRSMPAMQEIGEEVCP